MLQILELRNNKLTTPVGLKNMPNLTELYLVNIHPNNDFYNEFCIGGKLVNFY